MKKPKLDDIDDIHIVRWAVVVAAKRYGDGSYEALLTATPQELTRMLDIDLKFARRVSKLVLENERSRVA
jgi:hypothetical protein